jgi:hypothetical protein
MEIRADISASLAAALADEARLDVGQPDAIRPSVAADRCPTAAPVIRAIDQEAANASGAHFAECDLSGGGGHAPLKRGLDRQATGPPRPARPETPLPIHRPRLFGFQRKPCVSKYWLSSPRKTAAALGDRLRISGPSPFSTSIRNGMVVSGPLACKLVIGPTRVIRPRLFMFMSPMRGPGIGPRGDDGSTADSHQQRTRYGQPPAIPLSSRPKIFFSRSAALFAVGLFVGLLSNAA